MTYKQTVAWMFSRLPMYQRQGKTAFKKDLTNSLTFSKHLKFPEQRFKSIHVAGTNGKGSTSHMLASVLQEAGYKVGLYTSPHLKDYRERIKINGKPISKKRVKRFIHKNKVFLETHQLSFFEMTVGLAFHYFAKKKVDIAIIEVGLGGRLDSTNIITPLVSVITNIGLDHTQMLGNTLPEIAFEKAGIIKPTIPVVIGEFQKDVISVFKKQAEINKAKLYIASNEIIKKYPTDLLGNYQTHNVKTAVKTIKSLPKSFTISNENIINGLLSVVKNTRLLGRWQVLQAQPKIVCDTAHNKEGLTVVLKQVAKQQKRQLHIVLGVVNDKDLESILPLFPKEAHYYFCKPSVPRGLDVLILQKKAVAFGLRGEAFNSVNQATKVAKNAASKDDFIFIGGSTFVVAEVV